MKKLRICTFAFENGTEVNVALDDTMAESGMADRLKAFELIQEEARQVVERACEVLGRGRCLSFTLGERILVP